MAISSRLKDKVKRKEWDKLGKMSLLTLDLSNKHLTQLPKEVFELKEIEALDLTGNKNIDLSTELIKLTNLKLLCLDGCDLESIPAVVIKLSQLETLILSNNNKITLPDEMSSLVNLTVLDLNNCNLKSVPFVVMKLSQLEALILSNNENITLPDNMSSLINLTALILRNCYLDSLPPVVLQLLNLQELDLSSNQISLPDELYKLENIKVLRLRNCNLVTVPPAVLKLTQLEELDLSWNSGIHLPDELLGLINLRMRGMVTVIPGVGRLTELEWLIQRRSNPLQTLPSEIGQLTNMKHLDLSFCKLHTLPPEVWRLAQLEWLDLTGNSLHTLPAEIGQLTNMKHLDLSGCHLHTLPPIAEVWLNLGFNSLQTLPSEIGQLINMKHLGISNCLLHTLPPEVGKLTQLEWLDLSSTLLQTLPAEIEQLTNIKHLDLSNCELRTLPPEVGKLTQLEWLDLSHNSLQALPAETAQLRNACHLDVSGNQLIKPPTEVCSEGINAIRKYFDELQRSEEEVSASLKVVILGEKMAGKTSLVQTLSRGKSILTEEEERTRCVEITQWAPDDNITFEVYDFGGHDVYHLTHQFFLTPDASILLTVNLESYNCTQQSYNDAVGFWLDTLNARVPGAVVTVVGSKSDRLNSDEIEEKTRNMQERITQHQLTWQRSIQQQIKKLENIMGGIEAQDTDQEEIKLQLERTKSLLTRPLRLTGVCCVSSAEPTHGLDTLMSHIIDTANNTELFPSLRRILPRTWVDFELHLRDLRGKGTEEYQSVESTSHVLVLGVLGPVLVVESKKSKGLTREECLHQGQLAGLTADRLEPALSYLQQVGTILRYTDIPELKDLVFHDPSGLIDIIKDLFHHDLNNVFSNKNPRLNGLGFSNTQLKKIRKNLSSRGFLPKEVVIALLGPHATPVVNVDVITKLMEHFGLCYTDRFDEQDGETSTPAGYYIPWYIQEERPKSVRRGVRKRQKKGFTVTCEIAMFCPRGLFERLSVVVNKLIKSRQNWKDVIVAVSNTSSLPVIVRRETKDEQVNIIINVTVQAQAVQGTQVVWDVISPLKDKLSTLLKEWPGLLYRLVDSTFTQQAKQKGDSQILSVPSIIPTFAVGPGGRTVQHGGVTLEFPAGCVRDTRFISVEVEAVPVTEDVRTNLTAMSAVLTVEQDFPQRFLRPVTVRLPWVWIQAAAGKETTTKVLHYGRDDGWTVFKTDAHQEDGGIMFQTDHFQSFWAILLRNWLWSGNEVSWARQTYNDCIANKVYVIVTPDVNTLPERTLHLISLHKTDNIHDLFQATGVRFESQIKQRVEMTEDQSIEATFGQDEDVVPDPRDLPEGESMPLRPPTRRSVRLRVKESVPQKPIYEGKVKFTVTDETNQAGAAERPHFEAFVKLRRKGWPNLLSPLIFVVIAVLAVAFQLDSTGYIHGFWAQVDEGGHVPQHTSYSGKTVALLVNDEYGTSKGGISTINRQLAKLLRSSGAKTLCTVLNASEEDKNDAKADRVELIFPTIFKEDKRQPTLDWLTDQVIQIYPNLSPDITHIIGHASITSRAARNIKEQRYPDANCTLILFNHVIPEDTEHFKNESRVLGTEEKIDAIREDTGHADVVFSVGPNLYDYYENQIRGSKPHYEFLPKPSDIFSNMSLTYAETKTKVVLSIGRVKGAEKLKGYDLAAKAMNMVIGRFPKARWRVRGVSAEDFLESKEIIEANKENGTFHFTPLPYGTQQQLSTDLKEAHLVLMPSRTEPFGLVGLEAIAAGVPVLVSSKSGLAEFLESKGPEFDRPIVDIDGSDDVVAERLAKRIIKILNRNKDEFEAAKRLKDKLLASEYWNESHRKFLEECGIPQ